MRTIHLPSLSLIDSWITVKFPCKQSTGNTKTAKAKTALEVGGLLGKPALESTAEALLLGAGVCWACFNGFEVGGVWESFQERADFKFYFSEGAIDFIFPQVLGLCPWSIALALHESCWWHCCDERGVRAWGGAQDRTRNSSIAGRGAQREGDKCCWVDLWIGLKCTENVCLNRL